MDVTEQLAHVIAETTYADLPADAVMQGKRALLDTIGVTLAGYSEESSQIMTAWVEENGASPVATVLGSSIATSPALAALTNGTMGHALDFDDVTFHMRGHPSVPVAPVVLALGEATGASGSSSSPDATVANWIMRKSTPLSVS